MANPLLQQESSLPAFDSIGPAHVEPAIREVLEDNRQTLERLLDAGAAGWDGLVAPIERMQHRLART
jgi:oligopeptidase A